MNEVLYLLRKVRRELLFYCGLLFGTRNYGRVVIVTRSRSGSNMLCSLLESHPRAFVWREVFRRPHFLTPKLTQRLVHGRYLSRYRAVVFKVFYYHRVPDGFWERLIGDESIHIIHLVRKNFLETYISQRQATATRKWESFAGNKGRTSSEPAIHVDIADMIAFLEQNEGFIDSFVERTAGRRNLLTLTFDQVASGEGKERVAALLANHLDPTGFGTVRNIKQGSSRLDERISNFAEVRQAIANSKWRHLLETQSTQAVQ